MWNLTDLLFNGNECIMGNSVFDDPWFMVSAFAAPPGESTPVEHSSFNMCLFRACVILEHTIGLLKEQFPWLQSICKVIIDDGHSFTNNLQFLDVSIPIHNFLAKKGMEDANSDWIEEGDASVVDNFSQLLEEDKRGLWPA